MAILAMIHRLEADATKKAGEQSRAGKLLTELEKSALLRIDGEVLNLL